MIKHHPSHAILKEFVSGNLPTSVSVIIASHVEMCEECQTLVSQLTEVAAFEAFEGDDGDFFMNESDSAFYGNDLITMSFDSEPFGNATSELVNTITSQPVALDSILPITVTEIDLPGKRVALPRAIKSISLKEWKGFGKISRARFNLDDDERRTSLLHIAKGGTIPPHSHEGFEITLLIQGSFEDEYGTYQAGDFIWLDKAHTHSPITHDGCVCLTVSDDALRFTKGVSQLFNPLGKLIY